MKSSRNISRVFLDTSALLSGLNSPSGGAGIVLALATLNEIEIIISHEVITEVRRNLNSKFPLLEEPFLVFLMGKSIVTDKVTAKELRKIYQIIPSEDAPIAAGAVKGNADVIISLDQRFQKLAERNKFALPIITPGEFLKLYRKQHT